MSQIGLTVFTSAALAEVGWLGNMILDVTAGSFDRASIQQILSTFKGRSLACGCS